MKPRDETLLVEGPAWSRPGLDVAAGLYPLRVETHVRRLVDRLLPGVITVTPHARYVSLHAFVWLEASRRELNLDEAREFARRCEVVLAGVSILHSHSPYLPAAHGAGVIEPDMTQFGLLRVKELSMQGRYSQNRAGWSDTYYGSELLLGVTQAGRPPKPGPRTDAEKVRSALGDLAGLAQQDEVHIGDLQGAQHLCLCAAPASDDGPWLQRLLVDPPKVEELVSADAARRQTAQLLARVIKAGDPPESLLGSFRSLVAHSNFTVSDAIASALDVAPAWRGVLLRNYSVTAWRRIWAWLAEELGEDALAPAELADRLAEQIPDLSVEQMQNELPPSIFDDTSNSPEDSVIADTPRPFADLRILALGARRAHELEGNVLRSFVGEDEVLGPLWMDRQLKGATQSGRGLRPFARELALHLIERAQRVALSKMRIRPDGTMWIPMRVRERNGLLLRVAREGYAEIATGRIDTFGSMLAGAGVFAREAGGWSVTDKGAALLD